MFPHIITIFHHNIINGADTYTRQVVYGVYWYGSTGISSGDKGAKSSDNITVITSPENARNHGKTWTVESGDRIVKGVCGDISSFKELNGKDVITVMSVAVNILNSDVDNITITGA